jgi:hypothetical protein
MFFEAITKLCFWVQTWAKAGLQFAPGAAHEGCSEGCKLRPWTPCFRQLRIVEIVLTGLQPAPGKKLIATSIYIAILSINKRVNTTNTHNISPICLDSLAFGRPIAKPKRSQVNSNNGFIWVEFSKVGTHFAELNMVVLLDLSTCSQITKHKVHKSQEAHRGKRT